MTPTPKRPAPPLRDHAREICKRLEHCASTGYGLGDVFRHWLELVEATLDALPAHAQSVARTGQMAADTPETQALWQRLRQHYKPQHFQLFAECFHILLEPTATFPTASALGSPLGPPLGFDILGEVYMQTMFKPGSGQFFTPWSVASMMAQMTILDGAAEVMGRLRAACDKALAGPEPQASLLHATLLTGLIVPPEQAGAFWAERVFPLIAPCYEPIAVLDPCCGSGVMLLAAARQFPAWMNALGLVQYYGVDIDHDCVTMARINARLYGLDGRWLHALALSAAELAQVPAPYSEAYQVAQAAAQDGDAELVTAIATSLRQQQTLFDLSALAEQQTPSRRNASAPPRRLTLAPTASLLDIGAS